MLTTLLAEIAESAVLSLLEPAPLRFAPVHERDVRRIRAAIKRGADGTLARLRPTNRNAFLLGCLDLTEHEPKEHLIVGFGSRYGTTTKIDGASSISGRTDSVALPTALAHAMWDRYGQHEDSELVVFHNHPYNPINFLFDNTPLPSRADRFFAGARGLSWPQIARMMLNQGRVLFYLGENGFVKPFCLPSLVTLLAQLDSKEGAAVL
jgi:hypothetical protein